MKKTSLLPDVNVWIALSFSIHIHHLSAKVWFSGLSNESVFLCRMTQQGFLRLATNPKVIPTAAVSLNRAWQMYDAILSDPRIAFIGEPPNIDTYWRNFTQSDTFSPSIWNDAYLAAFSVAGDYELVTFDKGFGGYQGLSHTLLT